VKSYIQIPAKNRNQILDEMRQKIKQKRKESEEEKKGRTYLAAAPPGRSPTSRPT
jgi:hypothetical protein